MFRDVLFTAIFTLGSLSLPMTPSALADDPDQHQARQTRPIQMGVSGSSVEFVRERAFLYCYAGTFGGLVEDANGTYILSNNHVLARENDGAIGEAMIQQGILDQGSGSDCKLSYSDAADTVAHLKYFTPLQFGKSVAKAQDNTVDAAIATIITGQVDPTGYIKDIGTLSPYIDTVANDRAVQKSGRTTGHTHGTVQAIGVTINVQYSSGYGRFYDQIHIEGTSDFSAGGDSGSVIVAEKLVNPDCTSQCAVTKHAVGLLFAGGGAATFANPITPVLEEMGTDMVGCAVLMGQTSPPSNSCAVGTVAPVTEEDPTEEEPSGGGPPPGKGKNKSDTIPAGHERAYEVMQRNSDRLFAIEGVLGHGLSRDSMGRPEIVVYLLNDRRAVSQGVPMRLEEFNVRTIVTGPIKAY